jgi:hypothetical protein
MDIYEFLSKYPNITKIEEDLNQVVEKYQRSLFNLNTYFGFIINKSKSYTL